MGYNSGIRYLFRMKGEGITVTVKVHLDRGDRSWPDCRIGESTRSTKNNALSRRTLRKFHLGLFVKKTSTNQKTSTNHLGLG